MNRFPPLLPAPRQMRSRAGSFRLRKGTPIVLSSGSDDSDFQSACALRAAIESETSVRLPVETHARLSDLGTRIELARSGEVGEGYQIRVRADRIAVRGEGRAGLRYGAETLAQLLRPRSKAIIACDINDAPDLEWRGLLLDISRGKVPKLETLKMVVDLMVALKLNLLMLYTEHVFRFRRHPLIGRGASPMEAWELRELDAYARARHVELVPTLQSLGHMHHILKIRRYRHLAESDRKWSISPALEASYDLLSDLYSEYLPNFSSSWFNANCDEPVDLGKGLSKSIAARKGRGSVYLGHLERVRALAKKFGKRTMVWGDVVIEHPEEIPRLSRELTLLDWWYEADHDFDRVKVFAENNIPFMVCSGTSSWNALFPRIDNALANIAGHAAAGKRYGALGLINTDWGDGGHGNLFGNSLYPIAWGAQLAWSDRRIDVASFDRAFGRRVFGDPTGTVGAIFRSLGREHRTGFAHFNHSPLKSLYYDDLLEAKFTMKVRRRVLAATLRRLRRIAARFAAREQRFDGRPQAREELRFAMDASILAARKGLRGHRFVEWLEGRLSLGASSRRSLSRELRTLAKEQSLLEKRLQKLWLARNRPSNFEITADMYRRSVRGLRGAARRLSD
jgi:hexosaminidase